MRTRWAALWLIAFVWIIHPLNLGAADSDGKSELVITIYPVTSGATRSPVTPISRVVVLSPQTGPSIMAALAASKTVFQRGGITVIEKTPAASSKETQGPRRRNQPHDDGAFLPFGKSIGADHVILLEVTDTLVLEDRGPHNTTYLHDERVAVKGIDVNTGLVVLEGTARWSQPVERAGEHIRELTTYAIARAICAPEKWVEASAANKGRGRCRQ